MRRALLLAGAALATLSNAHSMPAVNIGPPWAPSLVDVELSSTGGSKVKIAITNTSPRRISFLQRGTIMDDNPIHKLDVMDPMGQAARFIGVHPRISMGGDFAAASLQQLKPKQKVEYEMDAAELYDMTAGGTFKIRAEGILPWATAGLFKLSGETNYRSNILELNIEAPAAVKSKSRWVMTDGLDKRALMSPDCNADAKKLENTRNALAVCSTIAFKAAEAALKGNVDQFVRYFRTNDPKIRKLVSDRFHAVANECGNRSNKSKAMCTDSRKFCRSDYIAYTLGTEITNCDLYWTFPLASPQCHAVSQATTTIHEMTHVEGLFNPSTDDFPGHYGWPALGTLPPEQAILNGDNYGFYANAVYTNNVGC